jgi:hypothetical protein
VLWKVFVLLDRDPDEPMKLLPSHALPVEWGFFETASVHAFGLGHVLEIAIDTLVSN